MNSSRTLKNNRYGFTLIEILVGLAILSIISIGMYCAFFVVVDLQTQSRDESIALALAQGCLEEIRSAADEDFDSLGKVIDGELTYNPAVIRDPVPGFPEFRSEQRVIEINYGLKRAQATVWWDYGTGTDNIVMATLIARPATLLPGNIHGYVLDLNGNGIGNANVAVTWTGAGTGRNIAPAMTDAAGYYTFELPGGQYQIPTGDWLVSATANGYYDSNDPEHYSSVNCTVPTGLDVAAADIILTPLPDPGAIKVSVMDRSNGNSPLEYIRLALRQNGSRARDDDGDNIYWPKLTDGTGEYTYQNLSEGNYTPYTYDTYLKGYTCSFGSSPGDPGYDPPYWYAGWSSVWPLYSKPASFSGYGGPPDNVSVTPNNVTAVDIYLDEIPKNNVTGIVYKDDDRDGIQDGVLDGARVYVRWWNNQRMKPRAGSDYNNSSSYEEFTYSNTDGSYSINAYSSSFVRSNSPGNWNIMFATYSGYDTGYPFSSSVSVSGLHVQTDYNGPTSDVNFLLQKTPPPVPIKYGNVEGVVRDYDDDSPIDDVRVRIYGTVRTGSTRQTDINGYYNYATPEVPYPISEGSHGIGGTKNGYYSYSGGVTVPVDATLTHDFTMEKIGYGDIEGRVTSLATDQGIAGATITLSVYSGAPGGSPGSTQTDADGYYDFATFGNLYPIVETRGSGKLHTLSASADGYVTRTQGEVTVDEGDTTTVNFQLPVDGSGF